MTPKAITIKDILINWASLKLTPSVHTKQNKQETPLQS